MTGELTLERPTSAPSNPRSRPTLESVNRRGPILRPARKGSAPGTFGLDLTAGCAHGCAYCHIRGSSQFPGEGRVLHDPGTSLRLEAALDAMERPPQTVVLSPTSDPLPPLRGVRDETTRIVRILLGREIGVVLLTRGRIPSALIDLMAAHPDHARVAVGLSTMSRQLSRAIEPRAASPTSRLAGLARLIAAGVAAEARVEPLIPGLTDTRENIKPLFAGLARAGVRRAVVHYLFQHPAMMDPLAAALAPFGRAERLIDDFQGGPVYPLGSLGAAKHLPLETRRAGLARLACWGAEHGLDVETGATQNPDFPRHDDAPAAAPLPKPQSRARARDFATA